jgi:hypothetical protein
LTGSTIARSSGFSWHDNLQPANNDCRLAIHSNVSLLSIRRLTFPQLMTSQVRPQVFSVYWVLNSELPRGLPRGNSLI